MKYLFDKKEHLHFLDGAPLTGTSSVANVIAKPLTWWASGLACEVMGMPDKALFAKIKKGEIAEKDKDELLIKLQEFLLGLGTLKPEEYLELLTKAYRAHDTFKKEAADKGTDLHGEISKWVREEIYAQRGEERIASPYHPKIKPLVEWAEKNVKEWLWSEMHCYSSRLFLGGICDLGAKLKDNSLILMDAKSSKAAYPNMFIQPALYDLQISENGGYTADGMQTFTLDRPITKYAIIPFGAEKIEPFIRTDVENCKKAALAALELYRFLPRD